MSAICDDLRHALRALKVHAGTTAIAIVTLAVGIGANAAIFSVVDKTLLNPLPFNRPDRLVRVWSTDLRTMERQWVSFPDYSDWRHARTLDQIAAWFVYDMTLVAGGGPVRLRAAVTYGDLFSLLGSPPALGVTFRVEPDRADGRLAVISDGLWRSRFGSDPAVVGRALVLSGRSYTIMGVMPPGFQFPVQAASIDLWASLGGEQFEGPVQHRGARLLNVIGRLKPGVAVEQAQAELDHIASALREQYPETNAHIGIQVVSATEDLVQNARLALLILWGAVVCVLLVACVNVANLLLAQGADRQQEIAMRAALGASRWRIGRQLLTECLLLAFVGGSLGALLAKWGVPALLALVPAELPRADAIGVDARVFSVTLLATLATGLLFGAMPAWRGSRIDLLRALRDAGSTQSEGAGARKLRNALVVSEIALALILVTGASLLIDSFSRLRRIDPGVDPRSVLAFRVSLPYEKYNPAQAAEFFNQLQVRLEALPGVHAASAVLPLPLNRDPVLDGLALYAEVEGRPVPRHERPLVDGFTVQPHYLRAVGVELLAGRDFDERDGAESPRVAIISESLARRLFSGSDPIGKRLTLDSPVLPNDERREREIVGVVADVRHRGLAAEIRPQVYTPLAQDPFNEFFIVLKTTGDPERFIPAARTAVLSLDSEQPIAEAHTLQQAVGLSIARERFHSVLLTLFSCLGLLLASVGLFGAMSGAVARRTHEFGIMMALGADRTTVLRQVARQGATVVFAGLCIGWTGAVMLRGVFAALVPNVGATPLAFAYAILAVIGVAFVACWVPARRATRVEPTIALRCR